MRLPLRSIKNLLIWTVSLGFLIVGTQFLYSSFLGELSAFRAKAKLEKRDCGKAIELISESIRIDPQNSEYYYLYGHSLLQCAGKSKSARALENTLFEAAGAFSKSIRLNPLESNTWLELAQATWWMSRFDQSATSSETIEQLLENALSIDPNNGKLLYAALLYSLSTGGALKETSLVKRLAINYPSVYENLKNHPEWPKTIKEPFVSGLKEAADGKLVTADSALDVMASIAREDANWSESLMLSQRKIESNRSKPNSGTALLMALDHLKLGQSDEARSVLLQLLRDAPNRANQLSRISGPLMDNKAFDLYVDLCRRTAELDPGVESDLPLILGLAYYANKDWEKAAEYFNDSLKNRETAQAYLHLAEIGLKINDANMAELASHRGTILEPQNSSFYLLLSRSLEAQHKYDAAASALERAIRINPGMKQEHINPLANLYLRAMNYKGAINVWNEAFQSAPRDPNYPRSIALAYESMGDYGTAERYYRIALELAPGDAAVQNKLNALRDRQMRASERIIQREKALSASRKREQ